MNIEISLKDIIWRLDNPNASDDEVPEHLDFLSLMWIDEYIAAWKDVING